MALERHLNGLIAQVRAFHGQTIYTGVEVGIAKKRAIYRYGFAIERFASRFYIGNLILLAAAIIFYRHFRYPAPEKKVFQYGPTRNNMATFERLNRCLPSEIADEIDINGQRVPLQARLILICALGRLLAAAKCLKRNRADRSLPHIQSTVAVAAYMLYTRWPLSHPIRLVCVASDHSPVAMALLFLAHHSGLKTCYIQHAPVTRYFPPLSYDLSLLHDQSSVAAYAQSASDNGVPLTKNIAILPPFNEGFRRPLIERTSYVVGFCLSAIPEVENVLSLATAVVGHASVSKVLLRCHPRSPLQLAGRYSAIDITVQEQGQSLASFLGMVDIVLVSSSGVAIEALHRGRPTFYMDGMDELPSDYYGFVAEGVLPRFDIALLDDPHFILGPFGDAWLARFANHDSTVATPADVSQRTVAAVFSALLSGIDSRA